MSAGNYYSPMPLDYHLLAAMPEKGIVGGVHWRGRRARDLAVEVTERTGTKVPMSQVQARLRSMNVAELVESFAAINGRIWARTDKGTQMLASAPEGVSGDAA